MENSISLSKLSVLGLQHVLAMYAGAVIVPLILGEALNLSTTEITYFVSADLLTCGIATILQAKGWGNFIGIKLPVIMGCTVVAVAPMITIGQSYGLLAIYGALLIAGFWLFLLAPVAGKLLPFFPPAVIGSIITTIGLSLVPVAINNLKLGAASLGSNLALGGAVFALIIVLNKYTKNFIRSIAILFGVISGTLIAYFSGNVDLSAVKEASWFKVIYPFYFGLPKFTLSGSVAMCLVALITMIESMGIFLALGKICERKISTKEITQGIRAEGLSQIIGVVLNSPPHTTFAQNVGLVALTNIKSSMVAISAGIILILLGLMPKFSALAILVPPPVLGAVMLIMFGMVAVSGIKILLEADLEDNNNLIIIASSVGIGVGVSATAALTEAPEVIRIIFNNGIVASAVVAIVLNLFLQGTTKNRVNN